MLQTNFTRLNGVALNKTVLDNLTGNTDSKAFIEETLNTALKDKLTTALASGGFTALADMLQKSNPVDIAANKDVSIWAFMVKQVHGRPQHDVGIARQ